MLTDKLLLFGVLNWHIFLLDVFVIFLLLFLTEHHMRLMSGHSQLRWLVKHIDIFRSHRVCHLVEKMTHVWVNLDPTLILTSLNLTVLLYHVFDYAFKRGSLAWVHVMVMV